MIDYIRKLAANKAISYLKEAIAIQEYQSKQIALCGKEWKKTLSYNASGFQVKWREFKISLIELIFRLG